MARCHFLYLRSDHQTSLSVCNEIFTTCSQSQFSLQIAATKRERFMAGEEKGGKIFGLDLKKGILPARPQKKGTSGSDIYLCFVRTAIGNWILRHCRLAPIKMRPNPNLLVPPPPSVRQHNLGSHPARGFSGHFRSLEKLLLSRDLSLKDEGEGKLGQHFTSTADIKLGKKYHCQITKTCNFLHVTYHFLFKTAWCFSQIKVKCRLGWVKGILGV